MTSSNKDPPSGVCFRRYRIDKRTGKIYDAWEYGLKAWPFRKRP